MGNTTEAVSTVLATFMAGLGLGSLIAAGFVDRHPHNLLPRLYGGLEAGIAVFGLSFPFLLQLLTPGLAEVYRAGQSSTGVLVATRFLTCTFLLLIPTTLMGATLPVLTAFLPVHPSKPAQLGRAVGLLYASNTIGAVLGSLATGVVLLYLLGVGYANGVAVALNLFAGSLVVLSARNIRSEEPPDDEKEKSRHKDTVEIQEPTAPWVVLVVIALSGLAALMDEVAWTRTLVLLIGPTTYGFSFVVTSVIAGIALGSAASSRWTARTRGPASLLAGVAFSAGVTSVAVIQIIGLLPVAVGELIRANADRMVWLLGVELLSVFLLLGVPSFLFGAAFPLAVRLLYQSLPEAGKAAGRVYAWNTFGAVMGSVVAGFLILPRMGMESTLYVAAIIHIAAGAFIILSASARPGRIVMAVFAVGASLLAPIVLPTWDRELLSGGMYKYAAYLDEGAVLDFLRRGELIFYKEGKVATVSVKRIGRKLSLAIDGKVDATNAADMLTQRLLAHVPLLLHPGPRDVCVIGHGSGVTAGSALTHPIDRLDAVEISLGVVEGSRFFTEENHNPLEDERLHLFVTDGRNHLLLTERTYDVIISEPSNPWMSGVSQLFTRDFFELARTKLSPQGLFCQWSHIYNMAEQDLKTIVAGFTDAFPEAALFLVNEGDLLLVGAKEKLPSIEPQALTRKLSVETIASDLASVEVRNAFTFASLYTVSTPTLAQWAADAPRHTDDHPVLEFRAPRYMHADTGQSNRRAVLELAERSQLPHTIIELRSEPGAEDLVSRALMLEKSDSFGWALEVYTEAAHRDPGLRAAHEGIVRTAIALQQPQYAEDVLRSFSDESEEPFCVGAGIALGLLYRNLDRYEEALKELGKSLSHEPESTRALLLASEIEGEVGRTELMEELAGIAMTLRAEVPEAEALIAEAALRRGEPELALSRALSIVERHPEQTRALQVVAIAHAQLGDRDAARAVFQRLTELEPNSFIHFNNFARLEMESNHFQAAADLYERSVDVNPRNVQGYIGLRDAARIAGNAQQLERALSMLKVLGVQE